MSEVVIIVLVSVLGFIIIPKIERIEDKLDEIKKKLEEK